MGSRRSDQRVFEAWKGALDPRLHGRAVPVSFRNGRLVVEVESAPLLQELKNFTGEEHRTRMNEHLGDQIVRRVAFKLQS